MAVSISICNMALGELRAQPIADISEQTLEARECARYYPQCLAVLLERHDWSFATRIASLALLYTNARIDEWPYAYGLPADFADVKRVLPSLSTTSTYPFCQVGSAPFIIEAGALYTVIEDARLEYSASSIPDARMTAMFIEALTMALASKLAVPIRDSRETKGELLKQAEIMAQRAIADDRNRQPQREEQSDEVIAARQGGSGCWRDGSSGSVYSPGGGAYLGDGDQQLVEG